MQSENDVPRFLRFKDLQEPGIAMTRQDVRVRRCHRHSKQTYATEMAAALTKRRR